MPRSDLCVVAGDDPREPILTRPLFLCIEIVSKNDRLTEVEDVIDDYLEFGAIRLDRGSAQAPRLGAYY